MLVRMASHMSDLQLARVQAVVDEIISRGTHLTLRRVPPAVADDALFRQTPVLMEALGAPIGESIPIVKGRRVYHTRVPESGYYLLALHGPDDPDDVAQIGGPVQFVTDSERCVFDLDAIRVMRA
jgi:hypothetical protein